RGDGRGRSAGLRRDLRRCPGGVRAAVGRGDRRQHPADAGRRGRDHRPGPRRVRAGDRGGRPHLPGGRRGRGDVPGGPGRRREHGGGLMSALRSRSVEVLKWISIGLFVVLVAVVVWQVFARQVLATPSAWTTTVSQYLLIWLVLFSVAM